MSQESLVGAILLVLNISLQVAFVVRVLLRPHREPASRIAWVVVVVVVPLLGILAYLFFGETNIGRRRVARLRESIARLPGWSDAAAESVIPAAGGHPAALSCICFKPGKQSTDLLPWAATGGTCCRIPTQRLTPSSPTSMPPQNHVHLLFYIWLTDHNGCKVVEALKRAAARGVTCRAMADDLGSRSMIGSKHWRAMREAGVLLAVALPVGNPLLRLLIGRIDLRNHRKIIVIDNQITYCGSQNCADPEFRVKAKYAPWVDAMIRFEGPIARQNQYLFTSDWMAETNEDISGLLREPISETETGFPAQVIGTGPTVRYSAMPEMFETLIYAARRELVITTPYYVPDESMQAALCASAYRGVETTIIFPARNDSWIVGAASRSYYSDLLAAGVRIFEYEGGLLHTKSLTIDGEITLIGSANMDRRSFELNFENNILFYDQALTGELRQRQDSYIASSRIVAAEMVESWSWQHRLCNNAIAMFGPVL